MKSNPRFPRLLRPALTGLALVLGLVASNAAAFDPEKEPTAKSDTQKEAQLLSDERQLTFTGKRAGEGYFSADGRLMVFQSERDPNNPFYQIYAMDLASGDTWRVSPGTGKTTCAWLVPGADRVTFSSTHEDPEAAQEQQAELEFRKSGQERRYSWDYDKDYDIFVAGLHGENPVNLTKTPGYDAEASVSPDGQRVVFASNREAYTGSLSDEDKARLEKDPSYFIDLYTMNIDGTDVRRLTDAKGYDGGPFFSADGKKIVWRRFSEDGATAEIHTMNVDGTGDTALTKLGAMSWAPYFHPSGDYIVFATNLQGFDNFELYMVDSEGRHEPVRVTYTERFDGLPVFSPDGQSLAWTSNRGPDKTSQIFLAKWNDAEARRLLGLGGGTTAPAKAEAATSAAETTSPDITPGDMALRIGKLASDEMEGRLTGTEGERLATEYVASVFESLGLEPAGEDGTYFQRFDLTAGVSLGEENDFVIVPSQGDEEFLLTGFDWRPLAFSKQGETGPAPVVFAGYGISAPADEGQEEYDSYAHLDVQGKWVMVFRFLPENVSPERRQFFNRYATLRHKAMVARDRGALGIIVVSGPNAQAKDPLVPLKFDASLAGSSVAAVSLRDEPAGALLQRAGKNLQELQTSLDTGDPVMGFEIPDVRVRTVVTLKEERKTGRNVLARLKADGAPEGGAVVIGAHVDHLGRGAGNQSLARGEQEESAIHYGADDNASGTAGLMEIAEYLAQRKAAGDLPLKRDVVFAAWSGEELGLLGSSHYVQALAGEGKETQTLPEFVSAYFNMDMIGRMREKVLMHGIGSSTAWPQMVERANAPIGLPVVLQNDPYIPSDSTSFYVRGVPFVSAFTGVHEDYHTPRDTADKINNEGAARIARLMARLVEECAESETRPDYQAMKEPRELGDRGGLRAYLGTIPDYSQTDSPGVKLSGVASGGPAEKAGLRSGDSIVELAGRRVENIYDYTYGIQALKIGEPVKIKVLRGEETLEFTITPASRE